MIGIENSIIKGTKRNGFFKRLPSILLQILIKLKTILKILLIVLLAIIVSVIILISNIDPNKYKEDIIFTLETTIDRKVAIEGDLSWDLMSFEPGIKLEKLAISNSPWATNKNILTAENIVVIISLKNLIKRKVSIERLLIDNPNIYLETSKTGKNNWDLGKATKEDTKTEEIIKQIHTKEANTTLSKISLKLKQKQKKEQEQTNEFELAIKNIKIENANIFYTNHKNKHKDKIHIRQIVFYAYDYNTDILFDAIVHYKNNIYEGSFKTLSIQDIINKVPEIPLIGIIDFNNIKLNFVAKITELFKLNLVSMNAKFSAPDLQQSLKDIVKLPKIKQMEGEFDVIATPKIISFKKLNIGYDTFKMTGDAEIVLNKKPDIKANLNIPLIDIPNLFYPQWEPAYFERVKNNTRKPSREKTHIEDPKAFRNIPLPVKEFDLANVILNLTVDKLKAMPEMPITNIKLNAAINQGYAVIAPLSMDYMGGKIIINIKSNNKNDTFNGEVDIKTTDINIGKIVDSTGYKNFFIGGNSDGDIILKGSGSNLAQFMSTLTGYIKVYTTSEMTGYNIDDIFFTNDLITSLFSFIRKDIIGTLTLQKKEKEQSNVQCAVVNVNVENGETISNRGVVIQTDRANVIIDGTINFNKETMDLSIITVVKEGLQISNNLAEMIKIEGSIARPSIIISKDGVVDTVAKTAFATVLVGALTGGVSLATAGLGMLTKSWLKNIREDKNPCLTAFKGKQDEDTVQKFDNQILLQETFTKEMLKNKQEINKATSKNINKTKAQIKKEGGVK